MKKFLFIDLERLRHLINSREADKWLYIDQFTLEAKLIAHKLEIGRREERHFLSLIRCLRNYSVICVDPATASNIAFNNSKNLLLAEQHFLHIAHMGVKLQYPECAEFIYAKLIAFCADILHMLEKHIDKDVNLSKFYFRVRDVLLENLDKLRAIPDVAYSDGLESRASNAILYSFMPPSLCCGSFAELSDSAKRSSRVHNAT